MDVNILLNESKEVVLNYVDELIGLRNENGEIKSTYQVLEELSHLYKV